MVCHRIHLLSLCILQLRMCAQDNAHLDTTWGGYCVFAEVADGNSMQVVDAIEKAKKSNGQNIPINRAVLQ